MSNFLNSHKIPKGNNLATNDFYSMVDLNLFNWFPKPEILFNSI